MSINHKALGLLCMIAFILANGPAAYADNHHRTIRVVTYNMYIGTDFTDVFQAQNQFELVTEVAEAYSDMLASNVSARAAEVADQIQAADPVLVGLQEVALWRVGAPFDPASAENVTVDQLQMLLNALNDRGLYYAPIAVQTNLDAELPAVFGPTAALDVRFTDRVVMLARTDLDVSQFKVEGIQTGTFATLLPISSPTIGTITIPRGWASADVKMRGKEYRFVTTHLESFFEPVQYAQAFELLQGVANTERSVILTGDFNSDAAAAGNSYQLLVGSGFTDAWGVSNPLISGYTWPLSAELPSTLLNPTQRLDLILTTGNISVIGSDVLGESPTADLTSSGERPSDHAGVMTTLVLEP
jgi:Endonuclease/Exonuclease/phosphatase family